MTLHNVWTPYNTQFEQAHSSKNTARKQVPKAIHAVTHLKRVHDKVLLDLGCGHKNDAFQLAIENLQLSYYGLDPFHQTQAENKRVITKIQNGGADIVTINNVLNTIKEERVWLDILSQARNALSAKGLLIVQIYEGDLNAQEKREGKKRQSLMPIQTRDGWQNRYTTERYLTLCQEIFPRASVIRINNSKFIFGE
jgi:hypothetical protein